MAGRLRALSAARLAVTLFLSSSGGATLRPVVEVRDESGLDARARADAA